MTCFLTSPFPTAAARYLLNNVSVLYGAYEHPSCRRTGCKPPRQNGQMPQAFFTLPPILTSRPLKRISVAPQTFHSVHNLTPAIKAIVQASNHLETNHDPASMPSVTWSQRREPQTSASLRCRLRTLICRQRLMPAHCA